MNNQAGQRIAGRFDLVSPYPHQPPNASAWVAHDTALSRQVRVTLVDDDAVIDAARRAALVSDPHLVSILQVVSDEDKAYVTEIPPGQPLADIARPLPAEQIHAIVGEAASAIATGARRGVRHLQLRADVIYVTDEGDVVVDGLGIHAALTGADTSKDMLDLDRDEARGLTVLLASLLLGRDFPEAADHDAVIAAAAELELPSEVAAVLSRERDGDGAPSPADLTRRLVPWGDIKIRLEAKWPPLDEARVVEEDSEEPKDAPEDVPDDKPAEELAGEPANLPDEVQADAPANTPDDVPTDAPQNEPHASTKEEVAALIDSELGLESRHELSSRIDWPRPIAATYAAARATRPKRTSLKERFDEAPARIAAANQARAAALEEYGSERGQTFNASRFVVVFFVIAVLIAGWFGFRALTAPFDPVTLTDPDSGVVADEPEASTDVPPAEPPAEEPAEPEEPLPPPVIANATLVSPDAGMIAGTDPATLDNPTMVGNAVDGDPQTWWESWTYYSPTMDPMSGIGLHIELGGEAVISEVVFEAESSGGNIQIRDTVPDAPSSGKVVAEGSLTAGRTAMTLDEPLTATSFVIWITELPKNTAGENQLVLNEITLN